MPRIVTIVGASAPTVETFVATTIVREPRFYVRQLSTGAGFGLIPKDRPHRAAIEILNPTTVADPREIVRLLGVTIPGTGSPQSSLAAPCRSERSTTSTSISPSIPLRCLTELPL